MPFLSNFIFPRALTHIIHFSPVSCAHNTYVGTVLRTICHSSDFTPCKSSETSILFLSLWLLFFEKKVLPIPPRSAIRFNYVVALSRVRRLYMRVAFSVSSRLRHCRDGTKVQENSERERETKNPLFFFPRHTITSIRVFPYMHNSSPIPKKPARLVFRSPDKRVSTPPPLPKLPPPASQNRNIAQESISYRG